MKVQTQRIIDRYVGTMICRILSLFHRFFKNNPTVSETNTILILLLSEMGALVLAYPMFQRLIAKFPHASIHILLFHKNREVVELLDVIPPENILAIDDSSMLTLHQRCA